MTATIKQKSTLLRLATWLLIVVAVFAAGWLVYESYQFVQWMLGLGRSLQVYRLIGLVVTNLVFTAIIAGMAILYLWVRLARSLPDLQGWHLQRPASEFTAADVEGDYSLDDYLEQEDRVFRELDAFIAGPWVDQQRSAYNRFDADSVCNPASISDRNWNRSFVLEAEDPVGGVLLIHGLSDAPYSLRTLGNRLHKAGYTVVWLRVPGHGTCPAALANVTWQDWTAAVKVAMCSLRNIVPDGCPLFLGGYSNGGALSVHYALASIDDKSLPRTDGIVLFSPMIGINPLARITRLYHAVALVSRNQKAQWSSVSAEIDPYKYSSWPMNANVQAWSVTRIVERKLAALKKADRMNEMPPVLAMQSVVDSTVVVPKLITVLFDRLTSELSELFLFDINRVSRLANLFNWSFEQKIVPLLKRTDMAYRLTVFTNQDAESRKLHAQTRDGEKWTDQPTEFSWPEGMISLSHIAVPIPQDDTIYGTRDATADSGLSLGSLSMRAEPSNLLLSDSLFVRCRHNPFYKFMEDRVVDWIARAGSRQSDC